MEPRGRAMRNAVLLQDYKPVPEKLKCLCRELQQRIDQGNGQLIDLMDDGSRDDGRPQIFKDNGKCVTAQKYVGLFEYKGERVVIGSRFDSGENAFFLRYLLETCWEASLLLDGLGSAYQDDPFDPLLVAKLALQLQRAWRKGTLRQYRVFQHNDSRVRGALDVTRHIRENLGLEQGKIAYRTRAYSLDNSYNALFLLACCAAGRKYPALLRRLRQRLPEFHAALQTLEWEVSGWSSGSRSAVLQHTRKKIVNPIHRDYEAARITARAILRRLGANPFQQKENECQVTGVFLDMNELWEQFLLQTLFRGMAGHSVQQSRDVLGGHMTIRPDFLWEDKGVVLDAKYRQIWESALRLDGKWSGGLSSEEQKALRENVYQVLAYMLLCGCADGGVIFPVRSSWKCSLTSRIFDPVGPAGQRFWRVPVRIPEAQSYEDFLTEMEREANRLRNLEVIRKIRA